MKLPLPVTILVVVVVAVAFAAAIFVMFFRGCFGRTRRTPSKLQQQQQQQHQTNADDVECAAWSTSKVADEPAARRLRWAEVELLTSGFTSEVVGEGGFSTVYLGRLPGVPAPVAVKVQRSSERLRRAFLQELGACLGLRRHPNIVRLVAYCDDADEGVLVFDYVPNGTLFESLHGSNNRRRRSVLLSWPQRMRIAHGVASAVAHLHGGGAGATQVVHGDLTSSNVLLDDDLEPLLCDLGSALVGFSAAVGPSRCLLLGSPGYADPLMLRTGTVSKKTDIYSFGVLLLELITGAPALVEEGRHSMLTAVAGPVVREGERERVRGIVDGRLGGEFDEGELMAVAEVAGRCIGSRPGLRPSMAEILGIMREKVSGLPAVDVGSDGYLGCAAD